MRLTVLAVGKIKKRYLQEGCDDYLERLQRYTRVEMVEIRDEPARKGRPADEVRGREGERILERVPAGALLVGLDERGDGLTTAAFSEWIGGLRDRGQKELALVIGGPLGLDAALRPRCGRLLTLAPFTLPHELARLVLLEQLYRVHTVLAGEPYHNP